MRTLAMRVTALVTMFYCLGLSACQTGVAGNDGGSQPLNDEETVEYKKAINRCYKTGGTRVVKIMGELRCY